MAKPKKSPLPSMPAFFGRAATPASVAPTVAAPVTPKAPAASSNPNSRGYSFPVYESSYKPMGLTNWVGTGSCIVRLDHMGKYPKGYESMPVDSKDGVRADDAIQGYLRALTRAGKPIKFAKVMSVPAVYTAKTARNQEIPVRLDVTLGVYLSDHRHVFVDTAFGPPPRTLFTPLLADKDKVTFAVDAEDPNDVGLLVAAYDHGHDEGWMESNKDTSTYAQVAALARKKFLEEALVLAYVHAILEAPTPVTPKEEAAQDKLVKHLATLPIGAYGQAYVEAMQLLRKRPREALTPLLEAAEKLAPL